METKENIISQIYYHVNNGGVNFKILDKGFGPVIQMDSNHFGCAASSVEVTIKQKDLMLLKTAIDNAIQYNNWTEEYCCVAKGSQEIPKLPKEEIVEEEESLPDPVVKFCES